MIKFKKVIEIILDRVGLGVRRKRANSQISPIELTPAEVALIWRLLDEKLSMTSEVRLFATALACKHVKANAIPGEFVECGVWRSGISILASLIIGGFISASTYLPLRYIRGMTEPTLEDCAQETDEPASVKLDSGFVVRL